MEDIQRECLALGGEKPKKPWELFADRSIRWQLITIFLMPMGQQLSGINAVRTSPDSPPPKIGHLHKCCGNPGCHKPFPTWVSVRS